MMKRDVVVLNEYGFLEKFKNYKRDNVLLGSVYIEKDGCLNFLYLQGIDEKAKKVSISANTLLKKTGFDYFEVVWNSRDEEFELMMWKG